MKRFTVDDEPTLDGERYRVLAGYDAYGYNPFDTITTGPGDQRFLQACGPFYLGSDSSLAIICAFMFADWHGLFEIPDTAVALIDQYAQDWCDMYWHLSIREYSDRSISLFFSVIPNPTSDRVRLQFNLTQPCHVRVTVYDAAGRLVKYIVEEDRSAGPQTVAINTDGLTAERILPRSRPLYGVRVVHLWFCSRKTPVLMGFFMDFAYTSDILMPIDVTRYFVVNPKKAEKEAVCVDIL